VKAYLDGYLMLEESGAGWTLEPGTAAHVRTFLFAAWAADELTRGASGGDAMESRIRGEPAPSSSHPAPTNEGSTLVLDASDEGRGVQRVERLTILGSGPADHPDYALVTVADRRWHLPRGHFRRSYNVRRRTGNRRRLPGSPLAIAPIADDVAYAPWSLKDETTPWTGEEVLEDVLNAIAGPGGWRRRGQAGTSLPDVENLELDDPYDVALGRVLAEFGLALSVYVAWDGTYVLYDRLDRGEFELAGAPDGSQGGTRTRDQRGGIGPPMEDGPLWAVQDRRLERPELVSVYFSRAVELRLDYQEKADGSLDLGGGTQGVRGQLGPPRIENVVDLPEDATIDGRDLVVGTFVEHPAYLEYLRSLTPQGFPLNYKILRDGYASPRFMAFAATGVDERLWATRGITLHRTYRTLFRLRRDWLDRVRNLRAYRVAILDPETGGRAPASIYADWAYVGLWAFGRAEDDSAPTEASDVLKNVYANPDEPLGGNVVGTPIEDLRGAPAEVAVVDEDQGILSLAFRDDFRQTTYAIYHSAFEAESIPNDSGEDDTSPFVEYARLTPEHEVSIVLTVQMGAPNDLRQFHRIDVKPDEVELPGGVPVGEAAGPPMAVRISPTVVVARHAWDDARAPQVYDSFSEEANVDLADALGDPINAQEVEAWAMAAAKRVYMSYADHVEGGLHTLFRAGLELKGTAGGLGLELDRRLGAMTTLDLPAEPPPVSSEALLPDGIRRLSRRFVDL